MSKYTTDNPVSKDENQEGYYEINFVDFARGLGRHRWQSIKRGSTLVKKSEEGQAATATDSTATTTATADTTATAQAAEEPKKRDKVKIGLAAVAVVATVVAVGLYLFIVGSVKAYDEF